MSATAVAVEREEPVALSTRIGAALDRPMTSYYVILLSVALLVPLGLFMVLSASSVDSYSKTHSSFGVFRMQAIYACIGVPLMAVASRLSVRAWRALAYPVLMATIALLTLVPIMGLSAHGNTNWLQVGGFSVQPSEVAKLALVLWGADLLARKARLLGQWKHLALPLVPVGMLVLGLVMMGKDLGTAMVLATLLLALVFFAGAPLRVLTPLVLVGVAMAALFATVEKSRSARISAWLDPSSDAEGRGYQVIHAKYAMATGHWFGVGPGASKEKWPAQMPAPHNDFIFAVIGEELGFFGSLAVLMIFAALVYGGMRVALRSQDDFTRLAAGGVTTWIAVQALLNIGAVIGAAPVIGVPLPLISAGGSALLATLIGIGLLLALARAEAAERTPRRQRRVSRAAAAARRGAPDRSAAGRQPRPRAQASR